MPPVFPEKILTEETVIEQQEITIEEKVYEEEAKPEVEPLPEKPQDANSEIVPNQNLTDDEIAQLILEEEELLNDKGVLGYNFIVQLRFITFFGREAFFYPSDHLASCSDSFETQNVWHDLMTEKG